MSDTRKLFDLCTDFATLHSRELAKEIIEFKNTGFVQADTKLRELAIYTGGIDDSNGLTLAESIAIVAILKQFIK